MDPNFELRFKDMLNSKNNQGKRNLSRKCYALLELILRFTIIRVSAGLPPKEKNLRYAPPDI